MSRLTLIFRNRATATLRDRTAVLRDAKTTASEVATQYNTAKATFDSEMAAMDKLKKFQSGQYVTPLSSSHDPFITHILTTDWCALKRTIAIPRAT